MADPELPAELQSDQDRFYMEVMGPASEMLFVEQWHSSSACSVDIQPDTRLWCHLLNLRGTIGVGGKPVQITVAIPIDSCERIGANMIRCAHLSPDELEAQGRRIT